MIGLKRVLAAVLGAVLAFALALCVLTLVLDGLGSSSGLMLSLMEKHAPSSATGLAQEHYAPMAAMITGYLSGEQDTFQYTITDAEGVETLCFHDYEQAHMADCRTLLTLDRKLLLASLVVCCFAAAGLIALRVERRHAVRGFLGAIGAVMLGVAALLFWGAIDFDSLFVLFHRLSFTNSLWLLNPSTDLLIRLMPTAFFLNYAVILAGTWLGILCLLEGAGQVLNRSWRKADGPEEPHGTQRSKE